MTTPTSGNAGELSIGITVRVSDLDSGLDWAERRVWQSRARFAAAAAAISAVFVKGFQAAVKAASDFEDAFAGVAKTVNASNAELAVLRRTLRDLAATRLPLPVQDLAKIAELGGQLGVPIEHLEKFTETIARLAVSTPLTAQAAATGLAQFTNAIGSTTDKADEFAAVLVELGNNTATTEDQILNISRRIAPFAASVGIAQHEVQALGATLLGAGIRAELGGTAIGRVITRIGLAAAEGGENLEAFASQAGLSAREFQELWGKDANEAISRWIGGLKEAQDAGENVIAALQNQSTEGNQLIKVLHDLQINGVRERQVILNLVQNYDKLRINQRLATNQTKLQNAHLIESEKRFKTTSNQVQLAKNAVNDLAIELGNHFLPAIKAVAQFVNSAANALKEFAREHSTLTKLVLTFGTTLTGLVAIGATVTTAYAAWKLSTIGVAKAQEALAGSLGRATAATKANTAAAAENAVVNRTASGLYLTTGAKAAAAAPKVGLFSRALGGLGKAVKGVTGFLGPWGLAIAGVTIGVTALVALLPKLQGLFKKTEETELDKYFKENSQLINAFSREAGDAVEPTKALSDEVKGLADSLGIVATNADGSRKKLHELREEIEKQQGTARTLQEVLDDLGFPQLATRIGAEAQLHKDPDEILADVLTPAEILKSSLESPRLREALQEYYLARLEPGYYDDLGRFLGTDKATLEGLGKPGAFFVREGFKPADAGVEGLLKLYIDRFVDEAAETILPRLFQEQLFTTAGTHAADFPTAGLDLEAAIAARVAATLGPGAAGSRRTVPPATGIHPRLAEHPAINPITGLPYSGAWGPGFSEAEAQARWAEDPLAAFQGLQGYGLAVRAQALDFGGPEQITAEQREAEQAAEQRAFDAADYLSELNETTDFNLLDELNLRLGTNAASYLEFTRVTGLSTESLRSHTQALIDEKAAHEKLALALEDDTFAQSTFGEVLRVLGVDTRDYIHYLIGKNGLGDSYEQVRDNLVLLAEAQGHEVTALELLNDTQLLHQVLAEAGIITAERQIATAKAVAAATKERTKALNDLADAEARTTDAPHGIEISQADWWRLATANLGGGPSGITSSDVVLTERDGKFFISHPGYTNEQLQNQLLNERKIARQARGGVTLQPGLSFVGEEGPELLHLPRGATVAPLTGPRAVNLGGGQQVTNNFYGDNYGWDDFVEKVGEAQNDLERRGIGDN